MFLSFCTSAPPTCRASGYTACCTSGDCTGSPYTSGQDLPCYCDTTCTTYGDCCSDHSEICVGTVLGSCSAAGYTGCCNDGSECFGSPANCKCDAECWDRNDCCTDDIDVTCPIGELNFIIHRHRTYEVALVPPFVRLLLTVYDSVSTSTKLNNYNATVCFNCIKV